MKKPAKVRFSERRGRYVDAKISLYNYISKLILFYLKYIFGEVEFSFFFYYPYTCVILRSQRKLRFHLKKMTHSGIENNFVILSFSEESIHHPSEGLQ